MTVRASGAAILHGFTVTGRHQLNGRVRATGLMRFRQRDRATCVAVRDRLTSSRRSPLQFRKHPLVGGDVFPNRQGVLAVVGRTLAAWTPALSGIMMCATPDRGRARYGHCGLAAEPGPREV
jgi:hypothetical protein